MAELFAQHTLAVYKITFNALRDVEKLFDPSNINGNDVIDIFCDFCKGSSVPAQVEESERFVGIDDYRRADCYVLTKLKSGRAGVSVSVFDTRAKCDSGISYDEAMAGMVESRMLLWRTAGLGYALACVESVPNGGGITTPLTMLKRHMNTLHIGATMRYERIEEAEALNAFSGIEEIELRRYVKPKDVSDDSVVNLGTISHILKHKPRVLMPLSLVGLIRKDRKVVAGYLGIQADYDEREEIYFTLRQKKWWSTQVFS